MSRETKVGISLAGSALALGVFADALFQGQRLGLNVPLWMVSFAVALTALLRLGRRAKAGGEPVGDYRV